MSDEDHYSTTAQGISDEVHLTSPHVLPEFWDAIFDEKSQAYYYHNRVTNELSWDVPLRKHVFDESEIHDIEKIEKTAASSEACVKSEEHASARSTCTFSKAELSRDNDFSHTKHKSYELLKDEESGYYYYLNRETGESFWADTDNFASENGSETTESTMTLTNQQSSLVPIVIEKETTTYPETSAVQLEKKVNNVSSRHTDYVSTLNSELLLARRQEKRIAEIVKQRKQKQIKQAAILKRLKRKISSENFGDKNAKHEQTKQHSDQMPLQCSTTSSIEHLSSKQHSTDNKLSTHERFFWCRQGLSFKKKQDTCLLEIICSKYPTKTKHDGIKLFLPKPRNRLIRLFVSYLVYFDPNTQQQKGKVRMSAHSTVTLVTKAMAINAIFGRESTVDSKMIRDHIIFDNGEKILTLVFDKEEDAKKWAHVLKLCTTSQRDSVVSICDSIDAEIESSSTNIHRIVHLLERYYFLLSVNNEQQQQGHAVDSQKSKNNGHAVDLSENQSITRALHFVRQTENNYNALLEDAMKKRNFDEAKKYSGYISKFQTVLKFDKDRADALQTKHDEQFEVVAPCLLLAVNRYTNSARSRLSNSSTHTSINTNYKPPFIFRGLLLKSSLTTELSSSRPVAVREIQKANINGTCVI